MALATLVVAVPEIPEADGAAQAQGIRRMLAARAGAEDVGHHLLRFHQAEVELVAACLNVSP